MVARLTPSPRAGGRGHSLHAQGGAVAERNGAPSGVVAEVTPTESAQKTKGTSILVERL
jgi:hypothetical protein